MTGRTWLGCGRFRKRTHQPARGGRIWAHVQIARRDRGIAEQNKLDGRLTKLRSFLKGPAFLELPEPHQSLLNRQRSAMEDYSQILSERIAMFGKPNPT